MKYVTMLIFKSSEWRLYFWIIQIVFSIAVNLVSLSCFWKKVFGRKPQQGYDLMEIEAKNGELFYTFSSVQKLCGSHEESFVRRRPGCPIKWYLLSPSPFPKFRNRFMTDSIKMSLHHLVTSTRKREAVLKYSSYLSDFFIPNVITDIQIER